MISGGNGEGVPPVPIPNTEVKPFSADNTWLDTAREGRSPPDSIRNCSMKMLQFFFILRFTGNRNGIHEVSGSIPLISTKKT